MPADLSGLSGATSRAQQTMDEAYQFDEDAYIRRRNRELFGDPAAGISGAFPDVAAAGFGLAQPEATERATQRMLDWWADEDQERQAQQIAATRNYTDILMTEPSFRIQESVASGMYEEQPTPAYQEITLANERGQRALDIQEWLGTLTNERGQRALDIQEELGVRALDIQQSLGQQRIDLQQDTLDWLVTQAVALGGASLLNTLLGGGANTGGIIGSLYTLLTGATFPGVIPTVTSWFTSTGTLSAEAQAALDAITAEDAAFGQALQSALGNAASQASTSLSSAGYSAGTIAAELANLGYGATDVATALANLGYTPDVIAAELANLGYEATAAQAAAEAATTTATTAAGTTAAATADTTAATGGVTSSELAAAEDLLSSAGMATAAESTGLLGITGAEAAIAGSGGLYTASGAAIAASDIAGMTATELTSAIQSGAILTGANLGATAGTGAAAAAGTTAATAAGTLAASALPGAVTTATNVLPYVATEALAAMPSATGVLAAGSPFAATPLAIIAAIAALTMTLNPQIPREQQEIERYERALGHLQEFGGSQESLAQHVQEAYAYGQAIGSLEYLNSDPATQSYAFLEYLASGGLNPAGIDVMGALGWQAGAYPDVNQMIADAGQWIMVSLPDQGGDVLMLRSDLEEIQRLGSQSEQGSQ